MLRRCLECIAVDAAKLLATDALSLIDQKLLCEILGRNQLHALRWANEQCRQNDFALSRENQRTMLGPALYKIRFALIPRMVFAARIETSGVLTLDEQASVYQQYHAHGDALFASTQFSAKPRADPSNPTGRLTLTIDKLSEFAQKGDLARRMGKPFYIRGLSWQILELVRSKRYTEESQPPAWGCA
uniref:SWIB domain-containing protein n=1 Tax=Globodera pallida TaxID=36090 RepID=A0A183CKJ7_GLOPA